MGKAKKRGNPKLTCRTNRKFKERYIGELLKVIGKLAPPRMVNKIGRPPHDQRVVAVLCAYMVAFQLTYDGIESELWLIGETIMELFGNRGMMCLPMKYIRRLNKIRGSCGVSRGKKMIVTRDATGFRVKTSSGCYDIRINQEEIARLR